jgi:hypothetical protein
VDGVDEWEPIRRPQVHVAVIQGTEELSRRTQFKQANYARQMREKGGGQFSPYTSHAKGA